MTYLVVVVESYMIDISIKSFAYSQTEKTRPFPEKNPLNPFTLYKPHQRQFDELFKGIGNTISPVCITYIFPILSLQ
jgi:hypothetical protein